MIAVYHNFNYVSIIFINVIDKYRKIWYHLDEKNYQD